VFVKQGVDGLTLTECVIHSVDGVTCLHGIYDGNPTPSGQALKATQR